MPSPAAITAPKQRILDATAELNALGLPSPTMEQLALFCSISHTTGSFKQNVRDLTGDGFLLRNSGRVSLTDDGRTAATRPRRRSDRLDAWCEQLTGPQAAILRVVVARRASTMADLGAAVHMSPTTGSFKQNVRDLRTYGLVTFDRGLVEISDLLSRGAGR